MGTKILIVSGDKMKKEFEDKGLLDTIRIIDAETPDGKQFVTDNNIKIIPECVIVDDAGKTTRCTDVDLNELFHEKKPKTKDLMGTAKETLGLAERAKALIAGPATPATSPVAVTKKEEKPKL